MAIYARENGLFLRPHVKSHKSLYMASRQMDHGATGLCVATSSEAQVMFRLGVDIMLAYPLVGLAKLQRVLPMLRGKRLSLVVDEKRTLDSYIDFAQLNNLVIPVYVEVDTGMNRSGALPGESLKGIMTHAGHAHSPKDEAGLAEVARTEAKVMGDLRFEIEKLGVSNFAVSAGSTLTSRYLKSSDGITEIRPGTYIYNDLRTMERWACSRDQIAVTMLTTISSARDRRVTLDAGINPIDGSISSDFREQARQVFANIGTVLQECGSDFSKVAKVNVYLADIKDFAALNEVYLEFFKEPFPARTTISCVLRGILIERNYPAFVKREPSSGDPTIYEKIRADIISGKIRPNSRLIEAELADFYDVSRTPVREAEYSLDEIKEIYEVRAALEGFAARLAAERATDEELQEINRNHLDYIEFVANEGIDPQISHNDLFHELVIKAARNQHLYDQIKLMRFYVGILMGLLQQRLREF
eukprot:gene1274-1289_t